MIKPQILVLGLGNILLKDDGFGVHLINQLDRDKIEGDVEILEGGTLGFNLLDELTDRELVIAVDAVKGDQKPGTIYKFNYNDIKNYYKDKSMSMHQLDFIKALEIGEFLDKKLPRIIIYGVQPESICVDMELSDVVKSKINVVTDHIYSEINKYVVTNPNLPA